nr:fumarylacetoacetate hydrolase family protein [Dehalococcoidia bacterium]
PLERPTNYALLHPSDIIWMGTQGADGGMVPGDTIEVEISGIGTLRNYVVRRIRGRWGNARLRNLPSKYADMRSRCANAGM